MVWGPLGFKKGLCCHAGRNLRGSLGRLGVGFMVNSFKDFGSQALALAIEYHLAIGKADNPICIRFGQFHLMQADDGG